MKNNKTMKEIKELAQVVNRNIFLEKEFIKVKNNLTTFQKKLVFFAFSQLTKEDRNKTSIELAQKVVTINVNEFLTVFNLKNSGGRIYNIIQEEIKKIHRTPVQIEINSISKSAPDSTKQKIKTLVESEISWFSKVDYYKNSRNHIIEILFTPTICDFLTQFNNYVRYNYFISHSLKSKHSIKIYELLQTRKDTNEIITNIDNFVYMLDLGNSYKQKAQLKKYVLKVAQKELNEKLELGFDFYFDKNDTLHLTAQKNDDNIIEEIFDKKELELIKLEEKTLAEFKKIDKKTFSTDDEERTKKIKMLADLEKNLNFFDPKNYEEESTDEEEFYEPKNIVI